MTATPTARAHPAPESEEILDRDGILDPERALARFDSLAPVEPTFMLGEWEGAIVPTGHPGEAHLGAMGWAGKTFHDPERVDPIVVHGPGGGREASDALGAARLREVTYRGVPTATMVYDEQPILDHFRKIDDDTVLGVMDRKGDEALLFFRLRRIPATSDAGPRHTRSPEGSR